MQSRYEANGERKYLNQGEWAVFRKAAQHAYTGHRISEALALTADRVDLASALTDHLWSVHERLAFKSPPSPFVPPKRRGRPRKLSLISPTI